MARKSQTSVMPYVIGGAVLVGGAALVASLLGGSAPKKIPAPAGPGTPGSPEVPTPEPDETFDPDEWSGDLPLPTASEVQGDLITNWGITPTALRPLFMLGEQVSGIRGSARLLSIIARRESRWVTTAHNMTTGEVTASTNAYKGLEESRPLLWGDEAAAFGSGGLFGLLAPYYLWSGWNSLKEKSPLLDAEPETMFFQRCSVFAALEYLRRVITIYDVRDHADVKVGWASTSLLSAKNRGGEDYMAVRKRFAEDVEISEISLSEPTIPDIKTMIADAKAKWPGVQAVFDKIVGTVPTRNKIVQA